LSDVLCQKEKEKEKQLQKLGVREKELNT